MSSEPTRGEQPSGTPKIIVDSDWKEQVAKEKQAAQESQTHPSQPEVFLDPAPSDDAAVKPTSSAPENPTSASPTGSLPEPTFEVLVSMLFTQAVSALGQMPSPIDGETRVDKPMAKHSIDMLDMLSAKTQGNLTDAETKMLGEALHLLRMAYVNARGE